jgi:predicted MPP superfamily phosphohydrolase
LLHVPLQQLAGAIVFWRSRRGVALLSGLAGAVILLIAVDAYFIEPHWLQVEKITIESRRITRPLRIAVVADLQTDVIGPYEKRALQRVVDENPDLILFTGDYLHEYDSRRYALLRGQLSTLLARLGLSAPLGAFAVRGNVEHSDWPDLFPPRVTTLTETTSLQFAELQLTGLDLCDSFDESLKVEGTDRFHIVFGHAPDFALGQVEADLLIAGHTHGGQIRFPLIGPLLTFSQVPRGWAQGVTGLSGGRKLVVSGGIGMERGYAPRLRFLCRPRLVFIDCVPAQ